MLWFYNFLSANGMCWCNFTGQLSHIETSNVTLKSETNGCLGIASGAMGARAPHQGGEKNLGRNLQWQVVIAPPGRGRSKILEEIFCWTGKFGGCEWSI